MASGSAALQVEVLRAVRARSPARASLERWARAAAGARGADRECAVRIVSPAESRRLNAAWRGKDRPTNVLSFPAPALPAGALRPLGDVVVCDAVVRAEARAQRKSVTAHFAHLVVHGILHLLGYDHERDGEARRMEQREVAVLRALGFPNPYRERG
jgi:probable rRNA maturation factor